MLHLAVGSSGGSCSHVDFPMLFTSILFVFDPPELILGEKSGQLVDICSTAWSPQFHRFESFPIPQTDVDLWPHQTSEDIRLGKTRSSLKAISLLERTAVAPSQGSTSIDATGCRRVEAEKSSRHSVSFHSWKKTLEVFKDDLARIARKKTKTRNLSKLGRDFPSCLGVEYL